MVISFVRLNEKYHTKLNEFLECNNIPNVWYQEDNNIRSIIDITRHDIDKTRFFLSREITCNYYIHYITMKTILPFEYIIEQYIKLAKLKFEVGRLSRRGYNSIHNLPPAIYTFDTKETSHIKTFVELGFYCKALYGGSMIWKVGTDDINDLYKIKLCIPTFDFSSHSSSISLVRLEEQYKANPLLHELTTP